MAKSYKLKDDNYIDSSDVVHNTNLLDTLLESMLNREQGIVDRIAGYGQPAFNIENGSGTMDWNTACGTKSGFYRGSGLANSPSGSTTANWWFVLHIVHDNSFKVQIAFPYAYSNIYIRHQNTSWSNWVKVI